MQVLQPAVVRWRTKGRFELRFGREAFPITAPTATGQLIVPPYSFEQVRVIATRALDDPDHPAEVSRRR